MPDQWGYHTSRTAQVSNVPTHEQGVVHRTGSALRVAPQPFPAAVPTVLMYRYPNCYRPVTKDIDKHELNEYCGKEHIQEDLRRGIPACSACISVLAASMAITVDPLAGRRQRKSKATTVSTAVPNRDWAAGIRISSWKFQLGQHRGRVTFCW